MRTPVRDTRPTRHPGICIKCRVSEHANREYFIDTGVDIDWEGTLYLCSECLKDIVRSTQGEYFTKQQVDDFLSTQTAMVEQATEIVNRREAFYEYMKLRGIDLQAAEDFWDANCISTKVEAEDGPTGIQSVDDSSDAGYDSESDESDEPDVDNSGADEYEIVEPAKFDVGNGVVLKLQS